jgi:hypothetical protein
MALARKARASRTKGHFFQPAQSRQRAKNPCSSELDTGARDGVEFSVPTSEVMDDMLTQRLERGEALPPDQIGRHAPMVAPYGMVAAT